MIKTVKVEAEAVAEDYGTGEYKWCDALCPLMNTSFGDNYVCALDEKILTEDTRGWVRCEKCREGDA